MSGDTLGALARRGVAAGLRLAAWYWRVVAPFRVGVRGIVHDEAGRIVLVRHHYGDRFLHLPGGGVHRREPLAAGFRRELREEVGVELLVDAHELRLLGTYSNLSQGKSDHVTVFVVDADQWDGRLHAADAFEIERVVTVDPRALPGDVSPGTRRRVDELLGRRAVDFSW